MGASVHASDLSAMYPEGDGRVRCDRFCSPQMRRVHFRAPATIGVSPAEAFYPLGRLFEALAESYPVRFEARSAGDLQHLDGVLLLRATRAAARRAARSGVPCYAAMGPAETFLCAQEKPLEFENTRWLAAPFRGRQLPASARWAGVRSLRREAGEELIASSGGDAMWLRREEGRVGIHLVGMTPAPLPDGALLHDQLRDGEFLTLLPLLHFLREIVGGPAWQPPPLRACIVLDDPSLRWLSYGCVRYPELARQTIKHNYHAAVAMIPLDAGRVGARVADLFRAHTARLSLLVHGNEHTYLELARSRPAGDRVATLAQALRRMEALEQKHRLKVCRIMEAPYGQVTCDTFDGLVALGYEAALVTSRLFRECNGAKPCPPGFGMGAVECLPGGLGGIPRITLASGWERDVLLAAFLGQPMVIAGHHQDADDGFSRLAAIAETINSLGPVEWCSLTRMARTQFQARQEDDCWMVRAGSRRLTVAVPDQVNFLVVERPWLRDGEEELLEVAVEGRTTRYPCSRRSEPIRVAGPALVEVRVPARTGLRLADVPEPRRRLWPVLRRSLAEIRDRAYPYLTPMRRRWFAGE